MRRLQPFPEVAEDQVVFHEPDFQSPATVSGLARGNGPASRACGAIDDQDMIERRARPNEIAHEPDARQRLGQSSTDLR